MKKYRCIIIGIVLLVCAEALVFYHYFYIMRQKFSNIMDILTNDCLPSVGDTE